MISLLFWICFHLITNATDVVLYPGQQETLFVGPGGLQVELKGIVQIGDLGQTLKIIGKKIGVTRIVTKNKTFVIQVISRKNYSTFSKLHSWKDGKTGPLLLIENSVPVIEGHLLTFDDWIELRELMQTEDHFLMRARVDKKIADLIKNDLKKTLEEHQLPFSDLITSGLWRIYVSKKQNTDLESYNKILSPLGIQINTSQLALSHIPMVEINIYVAEVNKKNMSQMGIQWPDQTRLQPFADQLLETESWNLTLNHIEQNGWGKVLASPTLVTQSGEDATFHSGGELPIRSSNQFNSNVLWKKYGIIVKIKPLVDFKGHIDVFVECEVSMLDGSTQHVDQPPGLLINKITSHFNLKEGRTIALSGLIKEDWAKGKSGLPGIKDIPILGSLFSSQSYMNNRSELMFFVTPKIMK